MKALVTLYHNNYQQLADVVLPNWRRYCDKHGYQLSVFRGENGSGAIGFQKMRWLRSLMEKDLDLALVLDLDILITNSTIPFESFVSSPIHDYYVTDDVNGINNGSFIIRNTPWSKSLIDFVLSHSDRMTNEQDVLKYNRQALLSDRMRIVPHPSLNSYLHPCMGPPFSHVYPEWRTTTFPNLWKEGCFALHLPGMPLQTRLDLLALDYIKSRIL